MKKYTKAMVLLLVVAMMLPGIAQGASKSTNKEYVTIIDLNLRAGADDTARPTAYVPEGEPVEYLGETSNGWFRLSYEGRKGYTHRGNVTSKSNYESNGKAKIHNVNISSPNNKEYRTVIKVNLRTGDANKFRSLALMPEGSSVIHLGTTDNGWFKVKYGEFTGYIYRGDVTSKSNYESKEDAIIHNVKLTSNATNKDYVAMIDLNLRSGDANQFRPIILIEKGSIVKHLGTTANGWFKVQHGDTEGYIYRGDITSRVNYKRLHEPVKPEDDQILANFKSEFFLLPTNVNYDKLEANKMMDRILNISPTILNSMYNRGIRMKLCKGPITNEPEYKHLKGLTPRGWEGTGKTWDDVPGAGGTITPIARIGHSNPGVESGHDAVNLELHELAHTIDSNINDNIVEISSTNEFTNIWKKEVKNVLPDDYFISYKEEYFAETFAMYHLDDSTKIELMQKAPKTHDFIMNLDSFVESSRFRTMNQEKIIDSDNIIIQEEILDY